MQRFAVGDRVIVINTQMARIPRGNVGTVVRVFARSPEICDVQFDTYSGSTIVLAVALAPAPALESPPPTDGS
jgi:Xrn1-like protein